MSGGRRQRGVTEVLSYVLVFSLIVTAGGLAYSAGAAELDEGKTANRLENAERAFGVFGTNVDDIVYGGATSRTTTVTTAGASVGLGDPVTFNLTVPAENASYRATVRPVVYRGETADIIYVNGAILREQRGGTAMLRRPPMVFGAETVVPYIRTRASGPTGAGGDGNVRIRTDAAARSAFTEPDEPNDEYQPRLNVTTNRTDVWRQYLETNADASCTTVGRTVSCMFTAERISVSLVRIDVTFGG
jgi:hypothetical protein